SEGDSDVPARLVRFVADVRVRFADAGVLFQRQLRDAVSEGRQTVTFELSLPPAAGQWARAFAEYFDEADEFCRAGELLTLASPPDVVAHPRDEADVARLLEWCAAAGVACVPVGGGTSVVGGVEALRAQFAAVVSLDLARLSGLHALDEPSQLATFGAGTLGPEVERLLEPSAHTLGHFPQSFEFSTVGGWAATRSAGQASTGYGRIDDLVVGLRAATPSGELTTLPVPASAAGPDLRELLLGSEGALGVITEVTLRVRPRPQQQRFDTYALPGFAAGTDALRELEQAGAAPDVARLSDEEETRISLALASRPAATWLLRAYMTARARYGRRGRAEARSRGGPPAGCMSILGFDGDPAEIALRRTRARRVLRRHGAVALGPAPGAAWAKGRFHGGYLRDQLIGRGVLVETLETATTWTALTQTHRAIRDALHDALARRGTPAVVMCHVSHLYPTGASLYFTFLARQQPGGALAQWQAAKQAACEAIGAAGATITHHHAVGRDHAPYLPAEVGALGISALQAVKARVDPAGIMNPGKLIA
ncbi:MAG: FAD-binding oxidoreductase, partial [Actinobacteria bacterium]|nr:FAD-binding oxidoreductase [Actinomycetota bacterium]